MVRVDELNKKAVLVTGASCGIGAAVSRAFAAQGAPWPRARCAALWRVLATCTLAIPWSAPSIGATRVDLNHDWQFRIDDSNTGDALHWASKPPADTESVDLPHTWNVGTHHDFLGVGWYFRRIDLPHVVRGTHAVLHFGATFYRARVWLNGIELGEHEGGYTAYAFDLPAPLRQNNVLVVRIDNRPSVTTIPGFGTREAPQAWYDWWTYGGIVRDVWLTTSGPAWLRRQCLTTEQTAADAVIHDRIFLDSALARRTPLTVRATAWGPDNRVAATAVQRVTLARGAAAVALSLRIQAPRLWGIDHPNLYRMAVELRDAQGALLDADIDTVGIRSIEIRDRHLFINGEHVRLTGLARHEDSPGEGLAETAGTMRRDYDDLKALHTTLTRPVHYPQNPFILDYADRHGIVLIPEIPVWQFNEAQLSDPRVVALAQAQMQELIEQAGNHPSVMGWSVANESATATPGGIAYFHAMRALIRSLDPGRPVSFTDDNLFKLERAEQSAAAEADFVMMNQYFGSWHGPAAALDGALDRIDQLFPHKMVIISEMGYAGIFAKNPVEADQARVHTLEDQMPVLAARDWIGGAILWCYQDYKSHRNLWPGEREGYVEHGLVDEGRQRKPSYEIWRQLTAPAHLTARWAVENGFPRAFTLVVTPNTDGMLPYRPLHDVRLAWKLIDHGGSVVADGARDFKSLTAAAEVEQSITAALLAPQPLATAAAAPTAAARAQPTLRLTVDVASPTETITHAILDWP